MGVSERYRKSRDNIIASYSFTNLIESTGTVNFYPGNGNDEDAAEVNIMSSTQFESNTKDSSVHSNYAEFTLLDTQTYSLGTATTTNTLVGKCVISLGWGIRGNNNNQGQSTGYIIARLVAGGVTLGEGKTETKIGTSGAYTISKEGNSTLTFDIPETILKVGDTLSIVLLIYGKRESGSVAGYVVNGHDPMNNDGSYLKPSVDDVDTMIKVQIPFKIRR